MQLPMEYDCARHFTPLNPELLRASKRGLNTTKEKLEDFNIFENRIYSGEVFFEVLNGLDDDVKNGVLRRPEHILRLPGRIVRVGISDEAISGFIQIGLEVETGAQRRLVLVRGHEWAVWRLHSLLEGKKTTP